MQRCRIHSIGQHYILYCVCHGSTVTICSLFNLQKYNELLLFFLMPPLFLCVFKCACVYFLASEGQPADIGVNQANWEGRKLIYLSVVMRDKGREEGKKNIRAGETLAHLKYKKDLNKKWLKERCVVAHLKSNFCCVMWCYISVTERVRLHFSNFL